MLLHCLQAVRSIGPPAQGIVGKFTISSGDVVRDLLQGHGELDARFKPLTHAIGSRRSTDRRFCRLLCHSLYLPRQSTGRRRTIEKLPAAHAEADGPQWAAWTGPGHPPASVLEQVKVKDAITAVGLEFIPIQIEEIEPSLRDVADRADALYVCSGSRYRRKRQLDS
jgi:hypothetical protein